MVLVSSPVSPDGVVPDQTGRTGPRTLWVCVAVVGGASVLSWLKGGLRQRAEELDLLVWLAAPNTKVWFQLRLLWVFFTTLNMSEQKVDERRKGQSWSSFACSHDKVLHSGGKRVKPVVWAVEKLSYLLQLFQQLFCWCWATCFRVRKRLAVKPRLQLLLQKFVEGFWKRVWRKG